MKKLLIPLLILSALLLSACSWLDGASQSVQYAERTKEYMTTLSDFAEQAPQMIKDAATDPEMKQKLEDRLLAVKEDIEQYNISAVPSIAKDLHNQVVEKNQVLLNEMNEALANGHLALDQLQNSQIVRTVQDITGLMNRIENLGL